MLLRFAMGLAALTLVSIFVIQLNPILIIVTAFITALLFASPPNPPKGT